MTVGFRLSPQQRLLWRLHGTEAGPFTGRSVLSVRGDLDGETLRDAVRRVTARHEILRTAFAHPEGVDEPLQIVRDAGDIDFRGAGANDDAAPDADLSRGSPRTRTDCSRSPRRSAGPTSR